MSQHRLAPAKVNLALHVVGRRADGYHLLESLVVFTELGDRLRVAPSGIDAFVVSGPFATGVPRDGDNLVLRARDLLRKNFPEPARHPVRIELEKNLPPASGIGGGSSDAAATLHALCELWALQVSQSELMTLAEPLGADLPMCIAAHPLIARGTGEQIDPAGSMPRLPLVLVNPGVPVSTPAVFNALAQRENAPLDGLPARIDFDSLVDWLAQARNDLQAPAISIEPAISKVLEAIDHESALVARMSGSGATCFGIFETAEAAQAAARRISEARPGWWVVATASRPSEADHAGH